MDEKYKKCKKCEIYLELVENGIPVSTMRDTKKRKRVPRKIFEPSSKMLKRGLYKNEQEVLQWILHNQAEQKINYYNKKITEMKQKYDMDFSAFESRICLEAGEEDFEERDDFILWEGYIKAYRYWEQYLGSQKRQH